MFKIGERVTVFFPYSNMTVEGTITKCLADGYTCRIFKNAQYDPGQEVHVVEGDVNRMVILKK